MATGKRLSIDEIIGDDEKIKLFNGYATDKHTLDYWEAWRIEPDKTTTLKGRKMTSIEGAALASLGVKANKMPCDDFYGAEVFRIDGKSQTTRGSTTFNGEAYYIDNINYNTLKSKFNFSLSKDDSPPGGLMAVWGKDSETIKK